MARLQESDYLQGFRFHVQLFDSAEGMPNFLNDFTKTATTVGDEAGFNSCTLPELSVETVLYREGTYKFTKKFPGVPEYTDVSLMRGVVKTDTGFYDWVRAAGTGGEYRTGVSILHYQRADIDPETGFGEAIPDEAARKYNCFECVPVRGKPAADLEGNSGEVSMAEMDFALEWFEIEVNS